MIDIKKKKSICMQLQSRSEKAISLAVETDGRTSEWAILVGIVYLFAQNQDYN